MVDRRPKLTVPTIKALGVLMASASRELAGAEIGREAGLASGTLYPLLLRLEQCGWVESRWETEDPATLGRPRRRFYRITGFGLTQARTAAHELEAIIGKLVWT